MKTQRVAPGASEHPIGLGCSGLSGNYCASFLGNTNSRSDNRLSEDQNELARSLKIQVNLHCGVGWARWVLFQCCDAKQPREI